MMSYRTVPCRYFMILNTTSRFNGSGFTLYLAHVWAAHATSMWVPATSHNKHPITHSAIVHLLLLGISNLFYPAVAGPTKATPSIAGYLVWTWDGSTIASTTPVLFLPTEVLTTAPQITKKRVHQEVTILRNLVLDSRNGTSHEVTSGSHHQPLLPEIPHHYGITRPPSKTFEELVETDMALLVACNKEKWRTSIAESPWNIEKSYFNHSGNQHLTTSWMISIMII